MNDKPNLENLKSWKPGQSGNPAGKPKGARNRTTIVRELLEALHESGRPNVEVATAAIIKKALAGDVAAWEKLLDSGFGKVTEKVSTTHSFTQMGKITASLGEKERELTFDVGEPPCVIEGDVEEIDGNE